MAYADIYGDIVDATTVEGYAKDTLQEWIVPHLAVQESRKDLTARTLPAPRDWPTVSEFDIEAHAQMPAIIIVSPGTAPAALDRGVYRVPWRLEVVVAVAGKDEPEARLLASLYLAAIKGALGQNPSLGGNVDHCRWTGPDDHTFGVTGQGGQRAIYGTAFEVTVADALNTRLGPAQPPEDPYDEPTAPDSLLEAHITVTAPPEDTP